MTKTLTQLAAAAALVAGSAFAPSAMADMYFGAKAGPMMIDVPGVDDPTNAAVMLGKEWGVVAGDIGVQIEASTSIDDGRTAWGNDVSINTLAAYGVFRSAGPVYFIGKAGVLREEIDADSSASDTGLSFGAGIGFSLGVAQIEVEYTVIEEDVSFLSAGIRF